MAGHRRRAIVNGRYSAPAIALHWLMAAGLAANFALGLTMTHMALSPEKLRLISWHKWTGITLLGLVSLRLLWRLLRRPPPMLPMPAWQKFSAEAVHGFMYALMFAIPLSGWLMSSAAGIPVVYLGLFPLPELIAKNKAHFDLLREVHESLNFTLLAVLVVHVAGALKHQLLDHDATLARMIPWLRKV